MLSTLNRYLIREYLKVFFLSLLGFLTLLIVSRLEEIAAYAALGSRKSDIVKFTLCQITYILPIVIPLSALISAYLLFQRLCESYELHALRACGCSLNLLLRPILATAALLALVNLTLTSELATRAHLSTRKMLYEITSTNPLVLLQNTSVANLKGAYVQFSPQRNGKEAKDLLIAWNENASGRLNLLLAKTVKLKNAELIGKNLTLFSSVSTPKEHYLAMENQEEIKTHSSECANFIHQKGWKIVNDQLSYPLLKIRIGELKKAPHAARSLSKCYSELVRRLALGCAPLTFTLMGMAFGMRVGRKISKRNLAIAAFLAAFTLTAFFVAKAFDHNLWLASTLFLLPHVLLVTAALTSLKRLAQGQE